jgi:hypothetical protein
MAMGCFRKLLILPIQFKQMSLDAMMIEVVSKNLPASAGYGSHSLQAMNLIFIEPGAHAIWRAPASIFRASSTLGNDLGG